MRPETGNPSDLGDRVVITNQPEYVKGKGHVVAIPDITAADGEENE
jgi:hypothetical protein